VVDTGTGRKSPSSSTLAERLRRLVDSYRKPDGETYSPKEMAAAIAVQAAEHGGPTVSYQTIYDLLSGKVSNPTVDTLEAIASFFGLHAKDILAMGEDEDFAQRVENQLQRLAWMRDQRIWGMAARMQGLSPTTQEGFLAMADAARRSEGLEPVEPEHDQAGGTAE
jgi:hypothetical protein